MRYLTAPILGLALLASAAAAPADTLAQAKTELAAGHPYSADALFQQVVNAGDASQVQVEEALLVQTMIYAGDVLGASSLIAPLGSASPAGSGLKAAVSQQLLLARRAFAVAANSYLTTSLNGSKLQTLKLDLPPLSQADVNKLLDSHKDMALLKQLLDSYDTDKAPGDGLLARTNQYSLYLSFNSAVAWSDKPDIPGIRAGLKAGVAFSELHYLDWLARVALDLDKLIKEPNGPDLVGLAKRCDQRIQNRGGGDSANRYVQAAQARAKSY